MLEPILVYTTPPAEQNDPLFCTSTTRRSLPLTESFRVVMRGAGTMGWRALVTISSAAATSVPAIVAAVIDTDDEVTAF